MNFLTHSLFAENDKELLAGQFCGDFVRGSDLSRFAPGISEGIVTHRRIDSFTDLHPELVACRTLFDPPLRRFAGIITDVVFDHFIARDWRRFHADALDEHIDFVHTALMHYDAVLPERLQSFSRFLQREHVLASYRHWRGVELSLQRIARRSPRFAPIAEAMPAVRFHETSLLRGFEAFFPNLVSYVQSLHINGHGVPGQGAGAAHTED